jgi:archaellum component FlaF (FlaF/FlaG flagellin family)
MEKPVCYNIAPQFYNTSQEVTVDSHCNGWTAVNTGQSDVWVNGFLLKPFPPGHPELNGSALGVMGNKGEYYRGKIAIVFEAGGTDPQIAIIQKYYIP